MPNPSPAPLRLVFCAADSHHDIHPLPLKRNSRHWLDLSEQSPITKELFTWDACIRHIYALLNKFGDSVTMTEYEQIDPFAENQLIVLFAHAKNLGHKTFYQNMLAKLRCVDKNGPIEHIDSLFKYSDGCWKTAFPSPVLTISEEDFMALYAETPHTDYAGQDAADWKEQRWHPEKNLPLYRHNIDHRAKFLDSGIWHRYLPEARPGRAAAFEKGFEQTLKEILEYREMGLYHARTALSTLEFQCRMLLHSYITAIGQHDHQEAVTPFKFHSETIARKKADELLAVLKEMGLDTLAWHMLMVDDYAARKLSSVTGQTGVLTKKNLIEYWLAGKVPSEIEENNTLPGRKGVMATIEAWTTGASNIIETGIGLLKASKGGKPKMYDIILLDYLLGEATPPNYAERHGFPKGLREYGHEFLLELNEQVHQHGIEFPRGPMGRFWIFPISTFPYAFSDKLHQLNIDTFSDQWFISNGGDPVSAPEMFRWTFFQMLLQQVSRYYLHPEAMKRWLEKFSSINKEEDWLQAVVNQLRVEAIKENLIKSESEEQYSCFVEMMYGLLTKVKYFSFLNKIISTISYGDDYSSKPFKVAVEEIKFLTNEYPQYACIWTVIEAKLKQFDVEEQFRATLAEAIERRSAKFEFTGKLGKQLGNIPAGSFEDYAFKKINLTGHNFESLSLDLWQMKNLTNLDLSHCGLKEVPKALRNLSYQLRRLNLSGNPCTEKFSTYTNARTNTQVNLLFDEIDKHGLWEH